MKNLDSSQISQAGLPQPKGTGSGAADCAATFDFLPAAPQQGAGAVRCAAAPDLKEEAANMLRLALSQEGTATPLSISSRQAQAVLGQF